MEKRGRVKSVKTANSSARASDKAPARGREEAGSTAAHGDAAGARSLAQTCYVRVIDVWYM